jgi:hypothetical protein
VNFARAALLAAFGLLAGCDGGLQIEGLVVRPGGQPVSKARVSIVVGDDSPRERQGPDVRTTDAQGHFGVARVDCACEFDVRIDAEHPQFGHARLLTTHGALERDPHVTLVLDGVPESGTTPAAPGTPR